jgi:hypothetical protein
MLQNTYYLFISAFIYTSGMVSAKTAIREFIVFPVGNMFWNDWNVGYI